MLLDVRPDHLELVREILQRLVPDREVWAFGSRAKWTARDTSDLDLCIVGDTPLGLKRLGQLRDAFSESSLPYKVDVVDWATTSESFRNIIERDKVVVQRAARQRGEGMTSEWVPVTLGKVLSFSNGKTSPNRTDGLPYPVYGSNGVIGLAAEANAAPETIVIGRVGSYCGSLYFSKRKCWITDNAIRANALDGNDARFLFYLLQTLDLNRWRAGSGQPLLNQAILSAIPASIPEPGEQRAIAHILGTLDDKIELNRRMNDTLEAMARALFKSWFVDFDPVRAKQPKNVGWVSPSGRNPPDKADGGLRGYAANPPYELPRHILDLFPARLVDSELGEIPEGWEVTPLPEAIDVNPNRALRKGDVAPYLDMANMPTRGHSPDSVIDRPFSSGMRFVNGDTLVARITPCLENGKTAYVDFLDDDQVGWGSTEYIVLRPKSPLPAQFAYCLARGVEFRDFAIQSMTGSSGRQRVPAESLSHFHMVAAPKPIAELFGRIIKPLFAHASAATKGSRTLAALRDALLPKLISGKLRMKQAEKLIEEVV